MIRCLTKSLLVGRHLRTTQRQHSSCLGSRPRRPANDPGRYPTWPDEGAQKEILRALPKVFAGLPPKHFEVPIVTIGREVMQSVTSSVGVD